MDLDNTLYPSSNPMEGNIVRRMNEFVASLLRVSPEEARELRSLGMPRYGTTLEWLMAEYGFADSEAYYAYVHPDGEEECIEADPKLGEFLRSLPYTKAIFTNSTREHAQRVLLKLGFADAFGAIFDIRFNNLKGKPHPSAGLRVCAALGVEPRHAVFVDDIPRYVKGFRECGGMGVLLDDRNRHTDVDELRISSLYELSDLLKDGRLSPELG